MLLSYDIVVDNGDHVPYHAYEATFFSSLCNIEYIKIAE